jgi:uncharacterized protein (DUF488 family)
VENTTQVWTGAYWHPQVKKSVQDGEAVAVGITLYGLKRSYGYALTDSIKELAPDRKLFLVDDYDAFYEPFMSRLENTWPVAESRLLGVMSDNPGKDVILLCFDRLDRDGDWCHRQLVAEFISKKWAVEVGEIGL